MIPVLYSPCLPEPQKRTFCIYSLPRSGSAWLSVFLSGRDSFCFHEPLSDYPLPRLLERINARSERVVGIMDTAAYRSNPQAAERFDQRFILLRDPEAIRRSSARFGIHFDAHAEQERLCALDGQAIEYARLSDLDYLANLWTRIVGEGFDVERARLMLEMRIERDVRLFFANRPQLSAA
jgi:hypothetical protein